MNSLALEAHVSMELPATSVASKPRSRRMSGGGNPGKHESKRVRARNTDTVRPWRQHSGSIFRRRTPRSSLLAQALHDETDDRAQSPEEFWACDTPVCAEFLARRDHLEYERTRAHEEQEAVIDLDSNSLLRVRLRYTRQRVAAAITPRREIDATLQLFELELATQYAT